MSNKKYEFVDGDTIEHNGITLKRIRAIVAIGLTVSAGDLGGYIQSEENLSRMDDAWVSDNAWVFGDARVSGDAWVFDDARVSGDAWVSGDACVSGNSRVSDNAHVSDNAWVFGDAHVFDNARVFDNAWVSGDARVSGNSRVSGDAHVSGDALVKNDKSIFWATKVGNNNDTLTAFKNKDGKITLAHGCFFGSISEFKALLEEKHSERTKREYKLLIKVAKSRILGE